jgi:hypothetical protein
MTPGEGAKAAVLGLTAAAGSHRLAPVAFFVRHHLHRRQNNLAFTR